MPQIHHEFVEITEVWKVKPTGIPGKYIAEDRVALFVNGVGSIIAEGYAVERRQMTKKEFELKGKV